jgi:hypothetical protein
MHHARQESLREPALDYPTGAAPVRATLPVRRATAFAGGHHVLMPGRDHLHAAIDLVRARISGQIDAEVELLEARGMSSEIYHRPILLSQTRVAAMLARALAVHEGRTPEQVLDSLTVAVMEIEAMSPDQINREA